MIVNYPVKMSGQLFDIQIQSSGKRFKFEIFKSLVNSWYLFDARELFKE